MSVVCIRKVFTRFYLRHAFQNAVVVFKSAFGDFPFLHRFANGAARVSVVLAVAVFAMAQIVMKFDKAMRDLFRFQMPQPELTYARGVDNVAAVREVIQARGRGGVLSKAGVVRDIIGQDLFLQAEEIIEQAGFTYALLTGKNADAIG